MTGTPGLRCCIAGTILLTCLTGCEDYNYNPGAGRQDVSHYLLVGEPSGDSLQPLLGVVWRLPLPEGAGAAPLLQLRSMGVETLLPAGDTLMLPVPLPEVISGSDPRSEAALRMADSVCHPVGEAGFLPMPGFAPEGFAAESAAVDAASAGRAAHRSLEGFLEAGRTPAFLSCRMATGEPAQYEELGRELRNILDEAEMPDTPCLMAGWGPSQDSAGRLEVSQALLAASWISLQHGGFDEAFLDATQEWACSPDGSPRPVLWLFALWRECAEHPVRLETAITMDGDPWSAPEGSGRLWALAGQDASGEVAILLANLTGDPASVEISLLPPALRAGSRDSVLRVETSGGGLLRRPLENGLLEIMPQEAVLVLAAPL